MGNRNRLGVMISFLYFEASRRLTYDGEPHAKCLEFFQAHLTNQVFFFFFLLFCSSVLRFSPSSLTIPQRRAL